MPFQPEVLHDNDQLTRWAYDPGVEKNQPTKGLIFKSDAPQNSCESFNWRKYLDSDDLIYAGGAAKAKENQGYLGYYNANVGETRSVH